MSNHPNRNWRSRWVVDLAICAITHKPTGMIVRFVSGPLPATPPPVGTLAWGPGGPDDTWVGIPDSIPDKTDRRTLPRLMREAGELYAAALKNRH